MTSKQWWKSTCATIAITSLVGQPALAQSAGDVTLGAPSSAIASQYAINPASEPVLPHLIKKALLHQKIKYVFVIFQENRAFDFYFGTFPNADGFFNQPSANVLGYSQKIRNTDGTISNITPFLIPQSVKTVAAGTVGPAGTVVPLYPADTYSTDHSQAGINNSMDVNPTTLQASNDRYALDEEKLTTDSNGNVVSMSTGVAPPPPPPPAPHPGGGEE